MESSISRALDQFAEEAEGKEWGDAEWTKQIKSRLAALGKEHRYWVYASGADNTDGGEWLYDLTWLNYSGDNLLDVELVLESEWNTKEIDDDFQKLLLAKSELRAMIFQAKTENEYRSFVEHLKNQIRRFTKSSPGDRYLFSCWIYETGHFIHESYCFQGNAA